MGAYHKIEDTGSVKVEAWIKRLRISQQKDFKTHIGNMAGDMIRNRVVSDINFGLVENIALDYCLERLRVNDREVSIASGDALKNLPEIDDDDYMLNTDDGIMRAIVKENRVLWKNDRFRRVFGQYAPEDEPADEVDPTPSPEGTSTNGPSSDSVTHLPPPPRTPSGTDNAETPSKDPSPS